MKLGEALRKVFGRSPSGTEQNKPTVTTEETRAMIRQRQDLQEARLRGLDLQIEGSRQPRRNRQ